MSTYCKIRLLHAPRHKPQPIPLHPGDPTPIEHVIFIIKENRTYDQVLGDLPEGNGDPSLEMFGEDIAPNHHRLAQRIYAIRQLLRHRPR